MGIVLKVTPEVLTEMAEEIDKQIGDIKIQFEIIENQVNQTLAYWEGDACESHKEQFDSLKDEIAESVKRLKKNPEDLLKMAGIYKQTESKQLSIAQALSTDIIV